MREHTCDECGSPMHVASTIDSGNAKFEDWQCDKCMFRKTVCKGVNT